MTIRSEKFFNKSENRAVLATIKDAESKTSGEIVTMLVDSSDQYHDVEIISGMMISSILAAYPATLIYSLSEHILAELIPAANWAAKVPDSLRFITGLTAFALIALILFIPAKVMISSIPALKRVFLHRKRIDTAVRQRAIRGFYEHGLHRTRNETGVLFMISLLEKRVYVLADSGIYSKIKQEKLDGYAADIGRGIAEGRAADALCRAIKSAGEELARYFPVKDDDKNELPDEIITER